MDTVTARREMAAAVVGSAAAGGLTLSTGGQTWLTATLQRPAPLPPVTEQLTGSALAGGVLGWSGLRTLVTDADATAAGMVGSRTPGSTLTTEVSAAWPALALVAGLLAVAAGLLTVLRGRTWPGMGRRYERPATAAAAPARRQADEDRALDAWRALDRGEDPTDETTEQR